MKFIIAALVLLIICGGVGIGGYFYYQSTKDEEETTDVNEDSRDEDNDEDEEGNDVTNTLRDILGKGKDYQCSWKTSDTSEGTLYTDGNKYRIEATESGQAVNIVYDGEDTMYFWDEASGYGFQYTLTPEEAENLDEDLNAPLDYDAEYDFDCDTKNVDSDKFAVPSDIDFMDFSDLGDFDQ